MIKRTILLILMLPVIVFVMFLFTAVTNEFKPETVETAHRINEVADGKTGFTPPLKIITWNIGYGGLGEEADFFMDGGIDSKAKSYDVVKKNLDGIKKVLSRNYFDFILLQEVDRNSRRSFYIDQVKYFSEIYDEMEIWHTPNYKAFFVPVPVSDPMGSVESGLLTLSSFKSVEAGSRYRLPGSFPWPNRLFNLKRALLVNRFYDEVNEKEWVVVNLHLSAYDDGNIREKELEFVREFLVDEYKSGSSVIAGGDWNHILPGFNMGSFGDYTAKEQNLFWVKQLPDKWMPEGWTWVYGKDFATVRSNEVPYKSGENFTTVLDGFLISPDLIVNNSGTINTDFKYSDHQPVFAEITYKTESEERNNNINEE
jgi:hypothetical protein